MIDKIEKLNNSLVEKVNYYSGKNKLNSSEFNFLVEDMLLTKSVLRYISTKKYSNLLFDIKEFKIK
jgi:hypothetical protein